MKTLLVFLILVTLPVIHAAVDPAPLPKEIRNAKTVFLLNQGVEPGTLDVVYDEIRKWNHWMITDDHEKADLIIVLSGQSYMAGMVNFGSATATGTATTYGNTTVVSARGSGQSSAVPLMQQNNYLTLADPKSGFALLTLSCFRREINGNARTGKTLVKKLKERFPKDQR